MYIIIRGHTPTTINSGDIHVFTIDIVTRVRLLVFAVYTVSTAASWNARSKKQKPLKTIRSLRKDVNIIMQGTG